MTAHPSHVPPETPNDHARNALQIVRGFMSMPPEHFADDLDFVTFNRELDALDARLVALVNQIDSTHQIERAAPFDDREQERREAEADCEADRRAWDYEREPAPPPDYGPPGSGAVITEYTGTEPGLEDDGR